MHYTKISEFTLVEVKNIKIDVKLLGFDEPDYKNIDEFSGIQQATDETKEILCRRYSCELNLR